MSLFHRDRNEITRSPPEAAVRARWPVPFSLCVLFGGEVVFAQVGCCVVFFFTFTTRLKITGNPPTPLLPWVTRELSKIVLSSAVLSILCNASIES